MRLKTFTADDMTLAMQLVRDTLGDDAVIISTQEQGSKGVSITAAFDDVALEHEDTEYAPWFDSLTNEQTNDNDEDAEDSLTPQRRYVKAAPQEAPSFIPDMIEARIHSLLTHHGVNAHLLDALMIHLSTLDAPDGNPVAGSDPFERWLDHLLNDYFSFSPLAIHDDSCRHILIGAPGAGKTLTTAKIAASVVKHNKKVHVISTDNKRAGGVEQLSAITDILGIELMIAENRQSLKSMLSDIPLDETVIVDSAGANPYDFYELKELGEYAGLIELDPILVYPAGSDPYEADEVARAFSFIGVEKMIITRIDAARRFGGVLNAAHAAGLKFANITGSEKILGTFESCHSDNLTKLFMDYQPQEG